jgi:nicotinate-nucleotide pyrophosphorylase (carboxylating)
MKKQKILSIIRRALKEDIGTGDITTDSIIKAELNSQGNLIVKEDGIIAGLEVAKLTFAILNPLIVWNQYVEDGTSVKKGIKLATIKGSASSILKGERVALNFLQRMSGIATLTNKFVEAVKGTGAIIMDTRKTVPGLRLFDKWAVSLGGGKNHRYGLYDMALIKDNHIAAAGNITEAIRRYRQHFSKHFPLEIEVKNQKELREALRLKPDRILLDNMDTEKIKSAVKIVAGEVPLEASGNINLKNVHRIAKTGVQFISIGALTHSARALDISLIFT